MSGRNGYMTRAEFIFGCQRAMDARPEAVGWTLAFPAPQDAERVWTVIARRMVDGAPREVKVEDISASRASASTPDDVVDALVRMIRDF